ncbi:hypothetical protein MKW92_007431 [Papaver armeniacum]|nr:hypothetical protein MKW92_007431 [Papaver armeniacum]
METRSFAATEGALSEEIRIPIEQPSFNYDDYCQIIEYGRNFDLYRPLLNAAMDNEWEAAEDFIKSHPDSVEVPITVCGRTALHIAAGAGSSNFVLKLIERMSIEAFELKDNYDGNTALHLAVIAGLYKAVEVLVQKNRNLTRICNKKGLNPLLNAAVQVNVEHREIFRFLCGVMKDAEPSNFQGYPGAHLICSIARAGLYELAHTLIREHPSLATAREDDGTTMLDVLAQKGSARRPASSRRSAIYFQLSPTQQYKFIDEPSTFLQKQLYRSPLNRAFRSERLRSTIVIPELKVARRVPPALGKMTNDQGETPLEVFTREHKDLAKKAEAYTIRTAESCLIVAALVATVAFAAAFTVPGGNYSDDDATNKGKPIFLGKNSFLLFMVVDALALFSSTFSIQVFLTLFLGGYAEAHFDYLVPQKLKIGLFSLRISVTSVIIAFSIALSIILGNRYEWAPYLTGVVACFCCAPSLLILSGVHLKHHIEIRIWRNPGCFSFPSLL